MTPAEQKRRKRARRACRQYLRECDGDRDDIGFPRPGIVARMATKALNRRDGRDPYPF